MRASKPRRLNLDTGRKILLIIFLVMVLVLSGIALWPAVWLVETLAPYATNTTLWVLLLLAAFLVFNYVYLIALLGLRMLVPRPKEGFHPRKRDGRMPPAAALFMFNVLITKARYHTPWSAMVSSVLACVFPLHGPYRRWFGPDSPSVSLGDTVYMLDPTLIEAGNNVIWGFGCEITAHIFDQRGLFIKRVKIGDNVMIGGQSIITAGVEVGHHAAIAARSVVMPGTIIKPYELWGGSPAEKIRDLPPDEEPTEDVGGIFV
jgi:hypothetical protein